MVISNETLPSHPGRFPVVSPVTATTGEEDDFAPILRLPPTPPPSDHCSSARELGHPRRRSWWGGGENEDMPNIAESIRRLQKQVRTVKRKIWRPTDEEARRPDDWERLAIHVIRSGLRGFNLTYTLNGTTSLALALVTAFRKRRLVLLAIVKSAFGPKNIRLSLVFGVWVALYKAVLHSLRLVTPISTDHDADHSGTSTPVYEKESLEDKAALRDTARWKRDPKSRIWHAYLAGAISGAAILVERNPAERVGLAQQLFVRGLEGTYNLAHDRGLVNIPLGSTLVFGLACGQIMYAYLNQPETLPHGYYTWVKGAAQQTPTMLKVHRAVQSGQRVAVEDLLEMFPNKTIPEPAANGRYPAVAANGNNLKGITGSNVAKIVTYLESAKRGDRLTYVPSAIAQPWEDRPWLSPVSRFLSVSWRILPVYATLYFVPAIFLRMRSFRRSPLKVATRSLVGSLRSSSFLGFYVAIWHSLYTVLQSLRSRIDSGSIELPDWLRVLAMSTTPQWAFGFATCLSLLVEHSRRRTELAMYVLPKGMESAWSVARKRKWIPLVPGGDVLLTGTALSLLMGTYSQNPKHLSGFVRRVLYQLVGSH